MYFTFECFPSKVTVPGPGLQQCPEPFLRLPSEAIPESGSSGSAAHRLAASTKAFSSGEEA